MLKLDISKKGSQLKSTGPAQFVHICGKMDSILGGKKPKNMGRWSYILGKYFTNFLLVPHVIRGVAICQSFTVIRLLIPSKLLSTCTVTWLTEYDHTCSMTVIFLLVFGKYIFSGVLEFCTAYTHGAGFNGHTFTIHLTTRPRWHCETLGELCALKRSAVESIRPLLHARHVRFS